MKFDAILWDYDGTIVNSVPKNIEITKQIIEAVAPRLSGFNLPKCLLSEEAYHKVNHQSKNWQDLYLNYYGMNQEELELAGPLWTTSQIKDNTPVPIFPGLKELLLKSNVPMGICSQNSSENIIKLLETNQIRNCFKSIIGYDDIPQDQQKPNPAGGLKCLDDLIIMKNDLTIAYIGDHEGDIEFARNIEKESRKKIKVIAIAVSYSGSQPGIWSYQPDFTAKSSKELEQFLFE
jgi:HAD superfamily hydrolase (TIGR01549 family)